MMARRSPAEFRRLVDEVRQTHDISEVVRKWTDLRPAGRGELAGLCVAHNERTPSMRVNDAKGQVYCFGCGYTADIFRVVQDQLGCSFLDALRWVGDAGLQLVDPSERIRQRVEDDAKREQGVADARELWGRCGDPRGTPAEVYLREVRGITMPLPPSLRFGFVPAWRDKETGEWSPPLPALVCAVYNRAEEVVGIQRIFLRDGGRAKARMRKPKKSLGQIKGASLRLGPVQSSIIVCEGPEDGLSLAQELPGRSVWPTLGTGLMPHVEYPTEVEEIVIAGQNDAPGQAAVTRAAESLMDQGYRVRKMFPDPGFSDWNDQLQGVRR